MVKKIIYKSLNKKTLSKKKKTIKKKTLSKKKIPIKKKTLSKKKKTLYDNKIKNNIVLKKGYCEASIMDENEIEDPCDIHKSFNECENETKNTNFWRSYNCKWK